MIQEFDFDKTANLALRDAQFGFKFKPVSSNRAYIPVGSSLILSAEGDRFKTAVTRILKKQKARFEWDCLPRYYSLTIIINPKFSGIDANNSSKLIQDAFVEAGIVPDDRYSHDSRQIYGTFGNSMRIPADTHWAVLIRWGKLIPSHLKGSKK